MWSQRSRPAHQGPASEAGIAQREMSKLPSAARATTPSSHTIRPVECEGCILNETAKSQGDATVIVRQTHWPVRYEIWNETGPVCKATYRFREYGKYEINVSEVTTSECFPKLVAEPGLDIFSIFSTAILLLLMIVAWYFMLWPRHATKYWLRLKNLTDSIVLRMSPGSRKDEANIKSGSMLGVAPAQADPLPDPKTRRLRSLDTFRGATILIMIFVHAGGYHLALFHLSAWNGLLLVDVVFPCFAFAMGEALVLTMNARLRRGTKKTVLLAQVVRRSLLLCCIGLAKNLIYGGRWRHLQLTGVMQRLGAMYLIVGVVECAFNDSSLKHVTDSSLFRDLAISWRQWLVTLSLVAVQVFVSLGVAAPGCPRGYLGPGGLHLSAYGHRLHNCTGGIAGHIDRTVLGISHLRRWNSTAQMLYAAPASADGMGLLGCLSGVLMVQAGAQAYRIMNSYELTRDIMMLRLLTWSVTFGLAGGAACSFSWNEGPIPINKTLTSVSYCLVTSSIAFFVQAVLYFLIDWKEIWNGRPLRYAGENSLLLYVGSEMLPLHWYKENPTHSELLITHTVVVLVWLAVAVIMHRHRIIVTV